MRFGELIYRMTTANNAKSIARVNADLNDLPAVDSMIAVTTMPMREFLERRDQSGEIGLGPVLGAVSYGQAFPFEFNGEFPCINVELSLMQGEPQVEVWRSRESTQSATSGKIRYCNDSKLLFGCIEVECGADLQAQTESIYRELLEFVHGSGYPHLLRVWNHFPLINAYEGALERYQMFCVGRHNAFLANCGNRFQLRLPAASAIGTHGSKFSLHFIAATEPGIYLENPRQMSAYCYPQQYGPRSPSFARATLCTSDGKSQLILSGTASIVGHETLHEGDPVQQLEETLRNIDALLNHQETVARQRQPASFNSVKVYVRHEKDLSKISRRVNEFFGVQATVLFLHGDICRSDLLLEIEGICAL